MAKLLVSVKRALENTQQSADESGSSLQIEEPVGTSLQMKTLREQAAKLAKHDSILLLQGEPGTGKKTFANYVHVLSDSRQKQFLVLNEDNFNDHDATKELFGTEVDAVVTPGHLELCKGGTIFIDDVANINAQGQKLLSRLLQRKQYNRVGGQVLSLIHI